MSILPDLFRRGGGDEMVVTRIYESNGQTLVDLMCPVTSSVHDGCPVVVGIGASIDATNVPWPANGVAWERLPRVAVLYVSSQTQSARSPIVVGVLKNATAQTLSTAQQAANTAAPSTARSDAPGPTDVGLMTAASRVICRSDGNMDLSCLKEFVVKAESIRLKSTVEPLQEVAVARNLSEALAPLYEAVNSILEFLATFPTTETLFTAAQASPEVASSGSVFVPAVANMSFKVNGILTSAAGVPAPHTVEIATVPYIPYQGPVIVPAVRPEEFDAPDILISPRTA